MKKKLVSAVMCMTMFSALLAGCGSTNTADTATSTTAADATTQAAATDATQAAADTAASTGAGKVYYLNFKPEADEQWQALAKTYT